MLGLSGSESGYWASDLHKDASTEEGGDEEVPVGHADQRRA